MTIKQIINNYNEYNKQEITLKGWVSTNRGNNKIRFIEINDGSTVKNLQVVLKMDSVDLAAVEQAKIGSAICVGGTLLTTEKAQQPIELQAIQFELLKGTDEDYPIQKKEITLDYLREIPHLRHRTNVFRSVMLIRSVLAQEIHKYFAANDFLYCNSPIITSNDGEGAGELFVVDDENKDQFFKQKATLGVTGQLHAESYALGFNKVYTFAPTFRAEMSHTSRHAAEFWMIEPECSFYDLKQIIKLADDLLKTVIKNTIEKLPHEFEFLQANVKSDLLDTLHKFINKKLTVLEYKDALEILKAHADKFEEKDFSFGIDLGSEHEKFLAGEYVQGPVAVINYPKAIKAFYMYQNDDNQTVAAFDLLVPGIGELIGGSQRETNYEKLLARMNELNMSIEPLQWYLDLRRFGDAMSSGFGIGFERLVMYVTGMSNIRDVIPYPRTPGNLKM
ncbi:asparagine--tRNA ligase [Mycoplasma phocoenae]|uniref:Asparagine--tRNA ligase n=1 Tax=Mycoplasma phocoenae TaxID=754517 RepID=A0A858U2U2_9MOLU|nr:asparagine--tRNA ligase [Mycoplasma phocoenae]QJG66732.1 asparagine--tRNA ligase [Mycoplasma phocoenae]